MRMTRDALFLGALPAWALTSCMEASTPQQPVTDLPAAEVAAPTDNLPRYFDCIDQAGKTLISAHRGGPADGYPENTLSAFRRATQGTGALLEVDVATSADGVLFLHHDDTLERTTTGKGLATETPWAALKALSVKDRRGKLTGDGLARLDDALAWADGKAILQLDIKRSTDFDDLAAVVNAQDAQDRVILIAYTMGQAYALNARLPRAMISAPINSADDLAEYASRGIDADRLLAWTGTEATRPALYGNLDNVDVEVIFGTLGGRQSIDKEIAATGNDARYTEYARQGVDVLATDRPFAAYAALSLDDRAVTPGLCL